MHWIRVPIPDEALNELQGIVPRILTSGPASNAWDGRFVLKRWVEEYGDGFEFVASGGLKRKFLFEFLAITNTHVCHIGSDARTDGVVDVEKVRELKAILGK